jgi:hypothetical protein
VVRNFEDWKKILELFFKHMSNSSRRRSSSSSTNSDSSVESGAELKEVDNENLSKALSFSSSYIMSLKNRNETIETIETLASQLTDIEDKLVWLTSEDEETDSISSLFQNVYNFIIQYMNKASSKDKDLTRIWDLFLWLVNLPQTKDLTTYKEALVEQIIGQFFVTMFSAEGNNQYAEIKRIHDSENIALKFMDEILFQIAYGESGAYPALFKVHKQAHKKDKPVCPPGLRAALKQYSAFCSMTSASFFEEASTILPLSADNSPVVLIAKRSRSGSEKRWDLIEAAVEKEMKKKEEDGQETFGRGAYQRQSFSLPSGSPQAQAMSAILTVRETGLSLTEMRTEALALVNTLSFQKAHKKEAEAFKSELDNEEKNYSKEQIIKALLQLVLDVHIEKKASLVFKEIKEKSVTFKLDALLCRAILGKVDFDNENPYLIKSKEESLEEAQKKLDKTINELDKKASPSLRCNDKYDETQKIAKKTINLLRGRILVNNTSPTERSIADSAKKEEEIKRIEEEIKDRARRHDALASFPNVLTNLEMAFSGKAEVLQEFSESLANESIYQEQIERSILNINKLKESIRACREIYESLFEMPLGKTDLVSYENAGELSEAVLNLKKALKNAPRLSGLEWSKGELLTHMHYPDLMQEACAERSIDIEREFQSLSEADERPDLRRSESPASRDPSSSAFFQPGSNTVFGKTTEATCG